MAAITKLELTDTLPLTCSRTGTCCHGKNVWLNPWELARLAEAKEVSPREFRNTFCEFGGIRLKFDGVAGWKGLSACSQYIPNFGCSVHPGRPLACRLYPIGLQRQGNERYYIYQGSEFPCMEGCPEVVELPQMSVSEYIEGQGAESCELAQDKYLELMENLADGAFALLLESGLAESGDRETLRLWRKMGNESAEKLQKRIGSDWVDRLMLPDITGDLNDPSAFVSAHYEMLQSKAQESFGTLDSVESFRGASALMMALALHLGRGLGANPEELAKQWISVAKEHGALD